jgi:rRNA processing protein Krr1/Pno1
LTFSSEPPKKQIKVENKVQEEAAADDTKAESPATEAKAEDAKVDDVKSEIIDEAAVKAPAPAAATKPAPAPTKPAPAPKPAPASSLPNGLPPGLPTGNPIPVNHNVAASLSNPASIVEERGEVSALYVGRVIGKGGEMIRDLQARSGCRIDVDQKVPPGQPRVITYRGTRRTVDFAKRLVHMLCQESSSEADLPLGEAKREYLVVPAQSVGKIIGRGGEMIRELQSRSSAKIQVDHSGTSGLNQDEKQVTITGTEQSVSKAKEMVLFLVANPMMDAMQAINMLVEEKVHRGGVWGSGPPYPTMPSQGQNMQPNAGPGGGGGYGGGGYDQQAPHYGGAPAAAPAYAAPQANPYGAPVAPYATSAPVYQHQQHQQQAPPAGYGQQGQQFGASGGVEMEVFYSAKNFMGRIIGQKGVTINDLQRRSACDIQINQDVPPGQECEISIRGSREGVEMAKQMLREIIEIGPNHPYAGGNRKYCTHNTQDIMKLCQSFILTSICLLFYFSQNLVVEVAAVEAEVVEVAAVAAAGTSSQHMGRHLRRMVVTSSRNKLLLTDRSTASGIRRKLMGCKWEDTKHLKQPPMPSRQIICPTNNLSTPMDSRQQLHQQRR